MYDVGNSCCTHACSLQAISLIVIIFPPEIFVRKPLHWLRVRTAATIHEVPWQMNIPAAKTPCALVNNLLLSSAQIYPFSSSLMGPYKGNVLGTIPSSTKHLLRSLLSSFVFILRILRPVCHFILSQNLKWEHCPTPFIFSQAKTFSRSAWICPGSITAVMNKIYPSQRGRKETASSTSSFLPHYHHCGPIP